MIICITSEGKLTTRPTMSFKEMQEFVGGYVEKVGLVICNEEGRLKNLPINRAIPFFFGNIIISDSSKF